MKKFTTANVLVIVGLSLAGYGFFERWFADTTGQPTEICAGNVSYLQFNSGVSVKYRNDGSIQSCQ